MKFNRGWIVVSATGLGLYALAGLAGVTLSMGDKSVPVDTINKNGKVYVPLADVAKLLDMQVGKTATGYAFEPIGGAGQVNGLNGKIGDKLNLGFGTYEFKELFRGKKYTKRFDTGEDEAREGFDIVAVIIRFKNATKKKVTINPFGGENTAITDTDEHSFAQFTGLAIDMPSRGPEVLPGAACDFALVFEVPEKAQLKDLVYTTAFYDGPKGAEKSMRIKVGS